MAAPEVRRSSRFILRAIENPSAVKEAAAPSDVTALSIATTREMLLTAQLLMHSIEELLDRCTSPGPSDQRPVEVGVQLLRPTCCDPCDYDREHSYSLRSCQECQASLEEDEETVVIEGFRFESAVSREDLMRPPAGGGRKKRRVIPCSQGVHVRRKKAK
ncbi:hypothetical protein EYF80_056873 [Liparis tanakae]|uniref:Uncharacterized protein n=1 Tax=Liparis tanakae TaxID=230148 RepID=A0A4Z2EVR0_9TELE|nr:hypothetical protein EYF80_056873 [Liparis tanakae]